MKLEILTFLTILFVQQVVTIENATTCEESRNSFFLSFLNSISYNKKCEDVHFYLGVKNDENGLKIGDGNWSALTSEHFKPSQKTIFVIHGYRSNYQKRWVTQLKDKLLGNRKINLILIDWKKGSNEWNYINSVLFAEKMKFEIARFLNDLKKEVKNVYKSADGEWKNLYFIGHSLGAHICGQTAHLIRSSGKDFYNIERITGLDPAQPCFTKVDDSIKLDKTDAQFVDIIHTQTGVGGGLNGLGLKESIGHIDFYVNGGIHQSECLQSSWTAEVNRMICSHKLACTYFIESIHSSESESCNFVGYKWDQTYDDALRILQGVETGVPCSNCPIMGIECSKDSGSGSYLVLTPDKQPHCTKYELSGLEKIQKAINKLNETTKTTSFTSEGSPFEFLTNLG